MFLALIITARCNAACTHCSTSCGPRRHESLPREKILSLMDEAAALAPHDGTGELAFGISGGEPFLDFKLLRDVVAHGKCLGAQISCVSNGYWATSDQKARELLGQLQDAGLDSLAISTSRFHEEFVKRRRVERALRAASALGIDCQLKYVRTRSDTEDDAAIESWARSAGADQVQIMTLLPALREGARLADDEYPRGEALPAGPCPAPVMTVMESGEAYTCCTPGAFNRFFSLGNVHQSSLRRVSDRFHVGGKQQILRAQGPAAFVAEIQRRGHGARLRPAYGDVCELCTHIGQDPVMAAVAEDVAREFEMQQLEQLLGRYREPAADQRAMS